MRTFRDFMESALYDPERGFYARRTPTEDFYTAPELHPAFGGALASAIAERLDVLDSQGVPGPYSIVEMGSGTGTLARQVILALQKDRPDLAAKTVYILVETAKGLLMQSLLALSGLSTRLLGYQNLEDVPPFRGVLFSNELVDAFPVHVLEKKDGRVWELYVDKKGEEVLGELSAPLRRSAAAAAAENLPERQRHAVNLEATLWLQSVASRLEDGFLLTVDYGKRFNPGDANAPRTFFRHRVGDALTDRAGRQDLTANVDFEQLISEGARLGLKLESYNSLSRFLLDHGIDRLFPQGQDTGSYKERAKLKTLIHPEGMGEVFKVLIQRRARASSC